MLSIRGVEIAAALERHMTPSPPQEDILLGFELRNQTDSILPAPIVTAFPCTLFLKRAASGTMDTIRWTPVARPGLPRPTDDPEVNLEPGQVWSPKVSLQNYLGSVPQGKYSVMFKLESSKYPFATDWMDFEVETLHLSPSSTSVESDVKVNQ